MQRLVTSCSCVQNRPDLEKINLITIILNIWLAENKKHEDCTFSVPFLCPFSLLHSQCPCSPSLVLSQAPSNFYDAMSDVRLGQGGIIYGHYKAVPLCCFCLLAPFDLLFHSVLHGLQGNLFSGTFAPPPPFLWPWCLQGCFSQVCPQPYCHALICFFSNSFAEVSQAWLIGLAVSCSSSIVATAVPSTGYPLASPHSPHLATATHGIAP